MTQTTCHCLACDPKSGEIGLECKKSQVTHCQKCTRESKRCICNRPSQKTSFQIDLPEAEATFLSVTAAHQEMSESCLVKCALRVYQLAMKGKLVSNEPVYGCGGHD